jgi:hypothetical protein
LVKRDSHEPDRSSEVGMEAKSIETEKWKVWYPVLKTHQPEYRKIVGPDEIVQYEMVEPITEDGTIFFDFLEASCEKSIEIIQTQKINKNNGNEFFYQFEKKAHCAVLRFHSDDRIKNSIEPGVVKSLAWIIIFGANPL